MTALPASYQPIEVPVLGAASAKAWLSPEPDDTAWDDFLRSTPLGQYQQSSLWAAFKAGEGWQYHRVVVTSDAGIVGGFQILWRSKGPARIGYLSKGPVAHPETPTLLNALTRLITFSTRHLSLHALIVQLPDETSADIAALAPQTGFICSNPMNVIEATYLIDLQQDIETLRARMSASLRRNLRKAKKRTAILRTGGPADLPRFFDLMTATCARQQTEPNPGSLSSVRRLWGIFSPSNSIRLTLAECEGQVPAAKLSLCFGDRLTVWKKGWNGGFSDWHPNELLEDEALEWGSHHHYRICDFCSFNPQAATNIQQGASPDSLTLSSRDEYHLRFGGRPMLLPRALVLLPNPLLRWGYQAIWLPRERRKTGHIVAVHP